MAVLGNPTNVNQQSQATHHDYFCLPILLAGRCPQSATWHIAPIPRPDTDCASPLRPPPRLPTPLTPLPGTPLTSLHRHSHFPRRAGEQS